MCEELGDPSPFRVKQGVGGPWTREILREKRGRQGDKRERGKRESGQWEEATRDKWESDK